MRAVTGFALLSVAAANRNAVGQTPIMGWSGCAPTLPPPASPSPAPPPRGHHQTEGRVRGRQRIHAELGALRQGGRGWVQRDHLRPDRRGPQAQRPRRPRLRLSAPPPHPTPTLPRPRAVLHAPGPCPSAAPHGERIVSADLNLDEYAQPPLAPTPLLPAASSGLTPRVREAAGSRRSAPRPAS